KLPAFEFIGELQVVDIGLPDGLSSWQEVNTDAADDELVAVLLPERTPASHKGTFGTAFLVAGSTSYSGAALLAATAAYRVGAGLVTLAVPEPLHIALAGRLLEATWVLLPHENGAISEKARDPVLKNLERATSVLIGPGLGDFASTGKFVAGILPAIKLPMVIDADGLRHIARIKDWHKKLFDVAVLTPHPGEMSALTGLSTEKIQGNREEVAVSYAKMWGHVVVLKGAFTIVAAPDGQRTVIPVATPALARAGTGDVLAGLIAGLRAQGLSAYDAAVAGAYIHARAGILAADTLGTTASVLAGDVLDMVSDVLAELE
ncbi:MAG TPA: NAD(P)H-hydrate dehydratase, partial [Anaerolineales bacterium]|nr:NAD(P)H-hydrate dehydratase [Anaerolineales bacterium]